MPGPRPANKNLLHPRPTKPAQRTPDERNALIAPLLPPNRDWVKSVLIRKYPNVPCDLDQFDEMLAVGYEALVDAGDTWEERYGENGKSKFLVYAHGVIRNAVRTHLQNLYLPMRVPSYQHQRPDFQAPKRSDLRQGILIVDPALSPEDELLAQERRDQLLAAVATLPYQQRYVVTRVLGLDGQTPQTPTEIAKDLGVTRQAVDKARRGGLANLRKILGDDVYID